MLTRFLFSAAVIFGLLWGNLLGGRPVSAPEIAAPDDFTVEFYPVAPFYAGDVISARVTYHGKADLKDVPISIALASEPNRALAEEKFTSHKQALFLWFLDTGKLNPGFLDFVVNVPDFGLTFHTGINLLPAKPIEQGTWRSIETSCCRIFYISGSDADRDIQKVKTILEEETTSAVRQFLQDDPGQPFPLEDKLTLTLVPQVVGQGGFATNEAVMTYSDRNWMGIDLPILAHHEIVHVLDRELNGEGPRPSLLSEGLAVYLSGGHYHQGPPLKRVAALLILDRYLPLTEIVNNFYDVQHETGYMEGAALVAYMVDRWGWETYLDFYFNLQDGETDAEVIDNGLEQHFGIDLETLETDFIAYLQTLNPADETVADVRLTIDAYDAIRRYQSVAIPSSNFQTAWWPPLDKMREEYIVGDYDVREKSPFNVIVESLLLEIHQAFREKDYGTIETNLLQVDGILDAVSQPGAPLSHYSIGWPLPELHLGLTKP
jgi:hypothetical protein